MKLLDFNLKKILKSADKLQIDPPVLTIEPPSPMPMSVSPYPKSYPESDSETQTPPTLFTTNTGTNPTTTQSILTSTKLTEFSTNFSSDYQPTDSPRRSRFGHKISHSFRSVNNERRPRINSRSSDRSSSEPPAAHLLPHIDLDRTDIRSSGKTLLLETNKFDLTGDSHSHSETGNGNPVSASSSSSFQNQSYDRRLLEANSAVSTGTPSTNNPNVPQKSGNVAISGGHSNSRHASGDSSPKGESYFEYLCP